MKVVHAQVSTTMSCNTQWPTSALTKGLPPWPLSHLPAASCFPSFIWKRKHHMATPLLPTGLLIRERQRISEAAVPDRNESMTESCSQTEFLKYRLCSEASLYHAILLSLQTLHFLNMARAFPFLLIVECNMEDTLSRIPGSQTPLTAVSRRAMSSPSSLRPTGDKFIPITMKFCKQTIL